jgi:hypothetical protein
MYIGVHQYRLCTYIYIPDGLVVDRRYSLARQLLLQAMHAAAENDLPTVVPISIAELPLLLAWPLLPAALDRGIMHACRPRRLLRHAEWLRSFSMAGIEACNATASDIDVRGL